MNIDNYEERKGNILELGPPGTGKTLLATQMPRPIIISADTNVRGPINYIKEHPTLSRDVRFWFPSLEDDEKTTVKHEDRWDRFCTLAERAFADEKCDTVVFDSFTTIVDYILDKVRKTNNKKVSTDKAPGAQISQPDWGTFYAIIKHFVVQSKMSPKLSVWIGHTTSSKDELAGYIKQFIAIPGQIKEQLAGLFDEVWLLSTEEEMVGSTLSYPRYIRTTPGLRQEALGLKTSRSLIGVKKKIELEKVKDWFK